MMDANNVGSVPVNETDQYGVRVQGANATINASGNVISFAGIGGVPMAPSVRTLIGFSAATTIAEYIYDQSPGGQYLFSQYDSTYGNFLSKLSIGTGVLGSLSKTAITATDMATPLKDTSGTSLTTGDIIGAWWVSETRFLFCTRSLSGATSGRCYLHLCDYNGGAWKVGSNSATFDNQQAVLALGLWASGHATNSNILHQRSLAIGNGKIIIGEYNINTSRTNGSTNDAVRIYQSTDNGETWSALLTFNTDGSTNQTRHVHAVRYDKYTGYWYFCFGDAPSSAIVRWDGTSSAPAANSPLTRAGFTGYPGWEVISDGVGFETRSGDLTIHPNSVYYMTDNSESNTSEKYAFHLTKSVYLNRIRSNVFELTSGRPPLIQLETVNGGAFWASMREITDIGSAPETFQGYDFWFTPDGITFTKIAKTRDNSVATSGNLANMMMTQEGKIVITGKVGVRLLPSTSNSGRGSLVVTPVQWDGVVRTLQGDA